MKKVLFAALVAWLPLTACDAPEDEKALQELNVNARYTVESVQVAGRKNWHISDALRVEVDKMVGSKLDRPALDRLAERIKKELRVPDVSVKVGKGTIPDRVVVSFEIPHEQNQPFDLRIAKFLYDSKQGWSGEGSAATTVKGNTFTFGMVSDGDELIERFAGVRA